MHTSHSIIKFADDTTVVDSLQGGCEGTLSVVSGKQPLTQYQQNKGDDRGLQETAPYLPIHIEGTAVEKVESFKVPRRTHHRQTEMVHPHRQRGEEGSTAKFGLSPKTLPYFYRCTIERILSGCIPAWYSNSTALNCKALQRVMRSEQRITGGKLPARHDTNSTQCHRKAQ